MKWHDRCEGDTQHGTIDEDFLANISPTAANGGGEERQSSGGKDRLGQNQFSRLDATFRFVPVDRRDDNGCLLAFLVGLSDRIGLPDHVHELLLDTFGPVQEGAWVVIPHHQELRILDECGEVVFLACG